MPTYEIALILRSFKKVDMVQILKKSTQFVLDRGGIVRSVENAGTDMLPYQMKRGREKFQAGRYSFMQVDLGPTHIEPLRQLYRREEGIIRHNVVKISEIPGVERSGLTGVKTSARRLKRKRCTPVCCSVR